MDSGELRKTVVTYHTLPLHPEIQVESQTSILWRNATQFWTCDGNVFCGYDHRTHFHQSTFQFWKKLTFGSQSAT